MRKASSFAALLVCVSSACTGGGERTRRDVQPLTAEQCRYFEPGGKVNICHRTGSARNRYVIIRASNASCDGHDQHTEDYVTSLDPGSPAYDPACDGQGCFPDGAPYDGTVECCEGLAPSDGYCRVVPCPANASGAPSCACNPGFAGALSWTGSDWSGACARCPAGTEPNEARAACVDVDECANGTATCGANSTCANTYGGYTCTCNAGYQGDATGRNCASGPCAANPCQNGGTCAPDSCGYRCACPPGYYGRDCERLENCAEGLVRVDLPFAPEGGGGCYSPEPFRAPCNTVADCNPLRYRPVSASCCVLDPERGYVCDGQRPGQCFGSPYEFEEVCDPIPLRYPWL